MTKHEVEWVQCPICSSKTRVKIRGDTILKNFPLFCLKCKSETMVHAENMKIPVIRESDAETQSR